MMLTNKIPFNGPPCGMVPVSLETPPEFHLYSKTGLHHVEHNQENEDACWFDSKGEWIAIALADGISSCASSQRAAIISSKTAVYTLLDSPETFMESDKGQILNFIIKKIQLSLERDSRIANNPFDEYGAALCCVLLNLKTKEILAMGRGNVMALNFRQGSLHSILPVENDIQGIHSINDYDASWMEVTRAELETGDILLLLTDGAWKPLIRSLHRQIEWMKAGNTELYIGIETIENLIRRENGRDDCTYCYLEV